MKPNLNLNIGKKAAPKATTGFLQLNLLPDVKKQLLKVRRERNLVISISIVAAVASAAVLVVISGILGSLKVYEAVTRNSINNSKKSIEASQKNDELDKYLTVQNQLVQIKGLKDKQRIYSRLLGYLVAVNPAKPNNVSLNTVTIGSTDDGSASTDTSGGVVMTIEGRIADFSALDVYKTTLNSAKLKYTEAADDDEDNSSEDSVDSDSASDNTSSDASSSDGDKKDDKKKDDSKSVNLFSNVTVQEQALSSDSSGNGGGVSFTIQVTFNELAFSNTIENPTVEVPNETTSDSSRNAPTSEGTEMFHTVNSNSNSSTTNNSNSSNSSSNNSMSDSDDTSPDGTDSSASSNGGSSE